MPSSRGGSLHDGVESSNSVTRFVDKTMATAGVPEYTQKLIGVCRLKVRLRITFPAWIIETIEDNSGDPLLTTLFPQTLRQRRFARFRHAEYQHM